MGHNKVKRERLSERDRGEMCRTEMPRKKCGAVEGAVKI